MGAVVGGNPYGSRLADGSTTWGKTRCVLIDGYTAWSKGDNSLVIDGGFYPSDGLHLRVWRWPRTDAWVDSNSNPHTEYGGPILGFADNSGAGGDSYISVGAYDFNGNDTVNPLYTSANNQLDENDAAACYTGRLVNGTYSTTADWSDASPASLPWFGQNIGAVSFTGYSSISGFTAF